jgi:hypothetical protein
MASNARHAAWQTERRFTVKLYPVEGSQTELACDLTDFLDAVDYAFEWLNSEDPARTGSTTLAIVETHDGVSEEVWTYPPAPNNTGQLVARLGFNPVTWAGVPEYSAAEQKSRLRERVASTASRLPLEAPSTPWITSAVEVEREPAPAPKLPLPAPPPARATVPADVRATARKWIRTNALTTWDDRLSRVLLILAGATLWFTVGLADPTFLVPLAIFVAALWWRHGHRPEPVADLDNDEWL